MVAIGARHGVVEGFFLLVCQRFIESFARFEHGFHLREVLFHLGKMGFCITRRFTPTWMAVNHGFDGLLVLIPDRLLFGGQVECSLEGARFFSI